MDCSRVKGRNPLTPGLPPLLSRIEATARSSCRLFFPVLVSPLPGGPYTTGQGVRASHSGFPTATRRSKPPCSKKIRASDSHCVSSCIQPRCRSALAFFCVPSARAGLTGTQPKVTRRSKRLKPKLMARHARAQHRRSSAHALLRANESKSPYVFLMFHRPEASSSPIDWIQQSRSVGRELPCVAKQSAQVTRVS